MRRPVPWLVVLLGLCTAAQADPRDLISRCALRVPAGVTGIEAIEPICPGLTHALSEATDGAPLAASSLARLSRDSLTEFLRVTAAPASRSLMPPDPAAVAGILRTFGRASPHQLSWWDRFKAWCLKWFVPANRGTASLPAWLTKFLPSIIVARALFYTLLGAIVVAVLFLVRNELRALGLLSRTRAAPAASRPSFQGTVKSALSLEQVLDSPLTLRPGLLFRLLVNELARQGQLEAPASLTHREVAERARLSDAQEREQLGQLSRLAELQVYGGGGVEAARSLPVLAQGEALYRRLRRHQHGVP